MKYEIKSLVAFKKYIDALQGSFNPYGCEADGVIIGHVESFNFSPIAIANGVKEKLLSEGREYVVLELASDMGDLIIFNDLQKTIYFMKEDEILPVRDKDWLCSYEGIREEVDYIIEMLNKHNPFF